MQLLGPGAHSSDEFCRHTWGRKLQAATCRSRDYELLSVHRTCTNRSHPSFSPVLRALGQEAGNLDSRPPLTHNGSEPVSSVSSPSTEVSPLGSQQRKVCGAQRRASRG